MVWCVAINQQKWLKIAILGGTPSKAFFSSFWAKTVAFLSKIEKKNYKKHSFCQKNTLPCFYKRKNVLELHMKLLNEESLKKTQNCHFLKNVLPHTVNTTVVFGNASKRVRICLDTHQEQVCAPKGTRNWRQNSIPLQ